MLAESPNHGPVSISFNVVINTTTGLWFPLMGGFGGSFKKTLCNEGHYVNKIMGYHNDNDFFRGLIISCTDGTERVASELNYLTTKKTLIDCTSNLLVTGIYVDVIESWNMVWGMRYICADKTATSWVGGIDKSYSVYQMCPKGSAVNGLFVQSGMVIDGMALSCQEIPFSLSYVKPEEDSPESPFILYLDENQPYIYFNTSILTGFIGYGGPQAMLLRAVIDYGGVGNGSFEIFSTTRKAWLPIRTFPMTLREILNDQLRLRLSNIEADVIPMQLYLNATSAFGHAIALPKQSFIINMKRYNNNLKTTSAYGQGDGGMVC
jgi:hypothetical protein